MEYTFLIKYVTKVEAESEDEAYDIAYSDYAEGWNFEAQLLRG